MRRRIAIVGTGIAGLGCGYFLHPYCDLTFYEQNNYLGGHTNTVSILGESGHTIPIDTGFMVYNETTYPNLTRLFRELDVPVRDTDMSFSVQYQPDHLEWCGSGWNHLFAQRRNLLRPKYWRMLSDLDRFNRHAVRDINNATYDTMTVEQYVNYHRYGVEFLHWFLIPMSSAIWSTSPQKILGFPVRTLLRFFDTHGFLGMHGHLQWKSVVGGSIAYIRKLIEPFGNRLNIDCGVRSISRQPDGVSLMREDGCSQMYDAVILACHADQALALLQDATPTEVAALGPFAYERNIATLHTDERVMPKRRLCWASWNYRVDQDLQTGSQQPSTHYWMNNLQNIAGQQNYFVSINAHSRIDPTQVLQRIEYEHPIFSVQAIEAQTQLLPKINRQTENQTVFFCGSYFKYGFHEDAFTSALALARMITGEALWA